MINKVNQQTIDYTIICITIQNSFPAPGCAHVRPRLKGSGSLKLGHLQVGLIKCASVWHAERSDSGLCYQISLENHVLLVAGRRQNQWQQLGQYSQNAKKEVAFKTRARFYRSTGTGQSDWPVSNLNSLGNTQLFTKALTERLRWSQMRENFPFNQTSKGEAAKKRVWSLQNRSPILLQTTFSHLFLVFVKEDVAAVTRGEDQRGSRGVRSQNSACRLSTELVSTLT